MEIIRHIKVDLYGDTQHFAVAAKQMDMGTRYIGVTLMEDGVVYEIPDNVEVIINMTKPDKTHVHNDGEKSGNEALIPLTNRRENHVILFRQRNRVQERGLQRVQDH